MLPVPVAEPVLIMVSGLPGTGKSHLSRRLAERTPLLILESDALRKTLFPEPAYTGRESWRLFEAIHGLTEVLLKRGISLILDATNLTARFRERLYEIADRLSVRLVVVRVEAPVDVVRRRLERRSRVPDGGSDADWEVYRKLAPTVEEIRREHHVVDTSRDITAALDEILRAAAGGTGAAAVPPFADSGG